MPDPAISVDHLHKTFTSRSGFWRRKAKTTTAIKDISFTVERGELFGLLGPNGAGKTTTVKILATILLPTSGGATILGHDVVRETQAVRERIGFTFGGARGLYTRLSAVDNLLYFAELYGLAPAVTRRRIDELLALVGLDDRRDDRVETYSSGMQQRLHLARALLHDPELIYLDEPTVGIDPVGARELRKTVRELARRGKTILLTTHYMAEAEELCDRIAIIKEGDIVALDSPASLKKRIPGDSLVEIEVRAADLALLQAALKDLRAKCQTLAGDDGNKKLSVRTRQPEAVMQAMAPFIASQQVRNLEVRNQTLEDVYISIIQGKKP
ncbi:MAG: ABC transporter ATP-binding protein [Anaerolineaceae bacterium]|nr:ABC transporter ATP-binding protein [Anaerolineaceae bacterium]MBN2678357.1 ABC transporter ATP-binding protein [Anaerolineaceae bacterium]